MRSRLGKLPNTMFGIILFLLWAVGIALAQDMSMSATAASVSADAVRSTTSTKSSLPSSTSSLPPSTHTVTVGDGSHVFKPDTITADKGDIIEFRFYPANHSVVRAEYQYPCIPYEDTAPNKVGFYSGYQPIDIIMDITEMPKWSVRINDTNPIFFYCSAPDSCIKYGMVGVINPNASTSLTLQRQLALNSSYSLNPGEAFPAEGTLSSTLPSATSTFTSTSVPASHGHALSGGAIAGIVIAALGVIALGAGLFFFIGRSNSLKDEISRKASTVRRVTPPRSPMLATIQMQGSPPPMSSQGHGPPGYFGPMNNGSENGTAHEKGIWDHWSGTYVNSSSSAASTPAALIHPHTNPHWGPTISPNSYTAAPPSGVHRSASHRSTGGTFSISPRGFYTRTSTGPNELDADPDMHKFTSPSSPGQGIIRSPFSQPYSPGESPVLGRGPHAIPNAHWGGAVNEGNPAEMDGGFVEGKPF